MNSKCEQPIGVARVGRTSARSLAAGVSAAAMLLALQGTAHAQSRPAEENVGLEEIVVTAQKREQSVQDVPIAVTAVTQETLQSNRVTGVMDLTGLAPGLIARPNAGSNGSPSFNLRGVFATASAVSQDRQTSIYVDGVYLGGNRGANFDLPDIQRIEVLRGPQGTLFGRNATAGAVSVVTRDPTGELHFRQELTVGNYDQLRTRTTIDTPQIGPFSAYFTFVHDEKRGDVRNLGAGVQTDYTNSLLNLGILSSPKYLGSKNNENYFAAIKFEPSDTIKIVYKYDRADNQNTPDARVAVALNNTPGTPADAGNTGILLRNIIAAQGTTGRFGPAPLIYSDGKRPDAANNAWAQAGFVKASGHSITTTIDLGEHFSVKNITAFRKAQSQGIAEIGGMSGIDLVSLAARTAFAGAAAAGFIPPNYLEVYGGANFGQHKQQSSETQFNYNSNFLTLTLGGIWYHSKGKDGSPAFAGNFGLFAGNTTGISVVNGVITPPLGNINVSTSETTSIAGYGQAEFHVTPQLDLVLGGRITRDKKVTTQQNGGLYVIPAGGTRATGTLTDPVPGDNPTTPATAGDLIFSTATFIKTKPTYSIGINYKPNPEILLYAKHSTGFLSGGKLGPLEFQPETVSSQELGFKGDLLNRRLRTNIAIWRSKYHNQQVAASGSQTRFNGQLLSAYPVVVYNSGDNSAWGVEAEITASPVDGLALGGNLGYTHTHTSGSSQFTASARPTIQNNETWVGSVWGQYVTKPIVGNTNLFFRLDGNYQGKTRFLSDLTNAAYYGPEVSKFEFVPARWILNGRVAIQHITPAPIDLEVAFWARNLTNNRDIQYALPFGFLVNASFQQARTIGVDVTLNY